MMKFAPREKKSVPDSSNAFNSSLVPPPGPVSCSCGNRTPAGWGYCVFGKVIDGMHIIDQIKGVATGSKLGHKDLPLSDVLIEKMQIIEEK